jgi:MarR family transcriptional regulator, organic hydroperoxide resistance regulator
MAPKNPVVDAATLDALLSLDNQFCFALHAASRLVVRAYRPVLRELDLTYPQYLVLLVLWEWDRAKEARPTVRELGERLDLDSGTLTPLLRRLEAKRLIVRERSASDERELFVRVTPAGAAMKHKACKVPLSMIQNSPIPLTEIVSLRDQLKRVRERLSAHENAEESS